MYSKITDGVGTKVKEAIIVAINNIDPTSCGEILKFSRRILQLGLFHRDLREYITYIQLYSFVYAQSYRVSQKAKDGLDNHKSLTRFIALTLKEVIHLDIPFVRGQNEDDPISLRDFYYYAYFEFNALLYDILTNQEFELYRHAINELNQIRNYSTRSIQWQIDQLLRDGSNHNNKLEALHRESDEQEAANKYKRHVVIGLRYWIYLLYIHEIIDRTSAEKFLNVTSARDYTTLDILKDILQFQEEDTYNYLGWGRWDYQERLSGRLYSPPNPGNWWLTGFIIDTISHGKGILNISGLDDADLKRIDYLYDKVKSQREAIIKAQSKLMFLLNTSSAEEFVSKLDSLISAMAFLKRRNEQKVNEAIATTAISTSKVQVFNSEIKHVVNKGSIKRLFNEFGSVEKVPSEAINEQKYSIEFEGGKPMFIDGPNSIDLMGGEQIGAEIIKKEEKSFFDLIFANGSRRINPGTLYEALNTACNSLKANGIAPNVILMDHNYIYSDQDLINSDRYKLLNESEGSEMKPSAMFDNIPVIGYFNHDYEGAIVVCNLPTAFQMRVPAQKEDESIIDVIELNEDEIEAHLNRVKTKWSGHKEEAFSDVEATNKIKTSVIIEVRYKFDFIIKDPNAYLIAQLAKHRTTHFI